VTRRISSNGWKLNSFYESPWERHFLHISKYLPLSFP
jgi:hypothetical protein